MRFLRRLQWLFTVLTVRTRGWETVGNRITYKGTSDTSEVTITVRDLTKPDAYCREELLNLLKTIRVHEEIMQWQVPEPVRCGYCGHCSPVDENSLCPVVMVPTSAAFGGNSKSKKFPCPCSLHRSGLEEAEKRALDKALNPSGKRRPDSDFTFLCQTACRDGRGARLRLGRKDELGLAWQF